MNQRERIRTETAIFREFYEKAKSALVAIQQAIAVRDFPDAQLELPSWDKARPWPDQLMTFKLSSASGPMPVLLSLRLFCDETACALSGRRLNEQITRTDWAEVDDKWWKRFVEDSLAALRSASRRPPI